MRKIFGRVFRFFNHLLLATAYRRGRKLIGTSTVKCSSWREAWTRAGNLLP